MEALVALGLACNVVQIVDCGLKVASRARQIYQKGVTAEQQDFQATARELLSLSHDLEATITDARRASALPEGDQTLFDLSLNCHATARELEAELRKLSAIPSGGIRSSLSKSLKSILRNGKLRDIRSRLLAYKDLLDSRILVQLFARSKEVALTQNDQLLKLNSSLQKFISGIAQGFVTTDALIQREARYIHDHIASEGKDVRDHMTVIGNSISKDIRNSTQETDIHNKRNALVQSLLYPEMHLRQEQIASAHQNTYEWIFRHSDGGVLVGESDGEAQPWASFVKWLQSNDNEVYWIFGRAGSGKSTLMNYVYLDDRTRQCLMQNHDANDQPPILVAYFFWKAGSLMQKSTRGMLQSLVFQILSQDQRALSSVVPDSTKVQLSTPYLVWSTSRLIRLLNSAIESLQRRVCVLLDGLDEFEEDEEELFDVIRATQDHVNVKVCVSSRPLRSFESRFGDCPRLRLQDLTKKDMELFISEKLSANQNYIRMRQEHVKDLAHIVDFIVHMSQGVFLWATLVVKDVLKGFDNRDSLEVLYERLTATPHEVDDIYSRMWSRYQNDLKYYETEAKYYFRLVLRKEMSLLEFTILTDESVRRLALQSEYSPSNAQYVIDRCEDKKVHALARCGGLVEVGETERWPYIALHPFAKTDKGGLGDYHKYWKVRISHRTAADFLQQVMTTEIQNNFIEDLDLRLRSLCILWLLVPPESIDLDLSSEVHELGYLLNAWAEKPSEQGRLLPDLYDAFYFLETTYTQVAKRMSAQERRPEVGIGVCHKSSGADFLGLMIHHYDSSRSFLPYVQERVRRMKTERTEYLTYLLNCVAWLSPRSASTNLVIRLLKKGARPMENSEQVFAEEQVPELHLCPWQIFIGNLRSNFPKYWGVDKQTILYVVRLFQECGADMAQTVPMYLTIIPETGGLHISFAAYFQSTIETCYKLFVRTNAASLLRRIFRGEFRTGSLDRELHMSGVEDLYDVALLSTSASSYKLVTSSDDSRLLMYSVDKAFLRHTIEHCNTKLIDLDPDILDDLIDYEQCLRLDEASPTTRQSYHAATISQVFENVFERSLPLNGLSYTRQRPADKGKATMPELTNTLEEAKIADIAAGSGAVNKDEGGSSIKEVPSWTYCGVRDFLDVLSSLVGGPAYLGHEYAIPPSLVDFVYGQAERGDAS
ncbi:MAG: hypothetical protein Q9160_004235 [Pyrenula sp. 1 TL-2023]